jgi:hypothetical protein
LKTLAQISAPDATNPHERRGVVTCKQRFRFPRKEGIPKKKKKNLEGKVQLFSAPTPASPPLVEEK